MITELRLLICSWLMSALIALAPKKDAEGILIVACIHAFLNRRFEWITPEDAKFLRSVGAQKTPSVASATKEEK